MLADLPGQERWRKGFAFQQIYTKCVKSCGAKAFPAGRWELAGRGPPAPATLAEAAAVRLCLGEQCPAETGRPCRKRAAPRAGRMPTAPGPCLSHGRISGKETRTQSAPLRVPATGGQIRPAHAARVCHGARMHSIVPVAAEPVTRE